MSEKELRNVFWRNELKEINALNSLNQFNTNRVEYIGYPILLLIVMWTIYIADSQLELGMYRLGVNPRSIDGLTGVLFMPLIHSQQDFNHILNNSVPTLILLMSLIYFYRSIALKVFGIIWIMTGLLTWFLARENYHIGMSGVIYGLVGFLFLSGAIRNYRPLMGVSLFIVFLYGSLIWGIFPMQEHVSWEGHLFGFISGLVLAFLFRAQGPQTPKYRYEIEQEMGIEPEDLEAKWRALNQVETNYEEEPVTYNYEYVRKRKEDEG